MFASSLRSRAHVFSLHLRPARNVSLYSTLTYKDLRRLEHDDLIDTLLTAKEKWLGEREKLRDQILQAEKQFHLTQNVLKDQLLASETKRNNATESRMQFEIELKLTKIRMRDLQMSLLRNQNRFNLRGIIESIAEKPDYDTKMQDYERLPSLTRGTQPRLDWISSFSPNYARFRDKILQHRGIRKIDFDRSAKSLYHELSKCFHENRIPLDSNQDDIIVDMTQAYTNGVFTTLDGAVLECFLHYRYIPYTAITENAVEQYYPVKLDGDLERTVLPVGYREQLYRWVFSGCHFKMDGDDEKIVSISP